MSRLNIITHRIYNSDRPAGYAVLVDRLWPRGLSKEKANLDDWWKDLAPSSDLRIWYNHDPEKWQDFRARYMHELQMQESLAQSYLQDVQGPLLLLYAAKDTRHTHALVLQEFLLSSVADRIEMRSCSSSPCSGDFKE